MDVSIEPLGKEDLLDVLSIEQRIFPEPWTKGQFERELSSVISQYFKAVVGDRLVGYTGIMFIADEAHLTTIGVHPDWQRQGIGKLLLCKAIRVAIGKGSVVVTLEVRTSNEVARKLYRRFGFSIVGQRKGYYSRIGEDAYVMDSPYLQSESYQRRLNKLGCR